MPYKPKLSINDKGKPSFERKNFLEETVRLADRTTRDVMMIAHKGSAKPRQLLELADAYVHAANRLKWIVDDLLAKAETQDKKDQTNDE